MAMGSCGAASWPLSALRIEAACLEPARHGGQGLLPCGAAHQEADVPGLQGLGLRVVRADELTQRGHRWWRRDVVVAAVDVEERHLDVGEVACPVPESDRA